MAAGVLALISAPDIFRIFRRLFWRGALHVARELPSDHSTRLAEAQLVVRGFRAHGGELAIAPRGIVVRSAPEPEAMAVLGALRREVAEILRSEERPC